MPASQKKKRSRNCMTVNVPIPTRMQLDYLVGLLEEYRPQVEGLTFGKVTRSIVIRCAVAYFERQAAAGNVGPEVLKLAGPDRRAGRVIATRRKNGSETLP